MLPQPPSCCCCPHDSHFSEFCLVWLMPTQFSPRPCHFPQRFSRCGRKTSGNADNAPAVWISLAFKPKFSRQAMAGLHCNYQFAFLRFVSRPSLKCGIFKIYLIRNSLFMHLLFFTILLVKGTILLCVHLGKPSVFVVCIFLVGQIVSLSASCQTYQGKQCKKRWWKNYSDDGKWDWLVCLLLMRGSFALFAVVLIYTGLLC